jgi:hypothetical protein
MLTYTLLIPPEKSYWPITVITVLVALLFWKIALNFFRSVSLGGGYIVHNFSSPQTMNWTYVNRDKGNMLKKTSRDKTASAWISPQKALFFAGFMFLSGLVVLLLGFGQLDQI